MALIVTRVTNPTGGTAKGSALTSVELDANFNNINDNKAELVSPSFTTPVLGTPTSGTLTNCIGLPATSITGILSVSHGGTGVVSGTSGGINYWSGTTTVSSSALLVASAIMVGGGAGVAPATVTTGTGVVTALGINTGTAGAFVVNGGVLGTPSSGLATNLTGTAAGLTAGTVTTNANLTGMITSSGNAASLGSFTSLQLLTALTDETGTGANVFANTPTLITPILGTPQSGNLVNCNGLTVSGGGTGLATLTTGNVILGAGTSNVTFVSPATSGNILTANGSTWTSVAPASTNLTGPITSVGTATSIASQTGTGTKFVVDTSPVLVTSIDGSATFVAFASSTTLSVGYNSTAASTTNISTGATATAVTKTVNIGTGGATGSTTNVNLGSASGGTVTVNNDLTITGNFIVNGTTTTVNSTTLTVDDINIQLGSVAVPSDVTAAGGGITLKGATDKTITWDSTNGWSHSEDVNVVSGKIYRINGTSVLSATALGSGVTGSNLTSVGTLGGLTVTATITGSVSGNAATVTTNANLTGDVTSTGNAATVVKINGTSLAALGTGILKNTTATGIPSIAIAADFPTLNQNTSGTAAGLSATLVATSGGTGQATYAAGDILYASATNTLSKLTKGTDTQLLTLASGLPSWVNAPPSGATIVNDTTTSSNRYPLFSSVTTTAPTTIYTSDAKYLYKPSTGELQANTLTASNGFFNTPQAQVDNYTVATGNSSMSIGPITIATGKVVTVSTGGRWIIV